MKIISGALGSLCGVSIAWLLCFHVEIMPNGFARIVYENGDLLHRILQLFNIA